MQTQGREGDAGSLSLTTEQFDRYAELVAAGEAEFPNGLPRDQEEDLVKEVRSRLRRRLVRLIARQIALEIAEEDASTRREKHHAAKPV